MFQILGFILIGIVIGVLARLIRPGRQSLSMLATIVVGMVAALIGGIIASVIGTGSIDELNIWGFIFAVIAAILLIPLAEALFGRKDRQTV